jgi:hypothetical protein
MERSRAGRHEGDLILLVRATREDVGVGRSTAKLARSVRRQSARRRASRRPAGAAPAAEPLLAPLPRTGSRSEALGASAAPLRLAQAEREVRGVWLLSCVSRHSALPGPERFSVAASHRRAVACGEQAGGAAGGAGRDLVNAAASVLLFFAAKSVRSRLSTTRPGLRCRHGLLSPYHLRVGVGCCRRRRRGASDRLPSGRMEQKPSLSATLRRH